MSEKHQGNHKTRVSIQEKELQKRTKITNPQKNQMREEDHPVQVSSVLGEGDTEQITSTTLPWIKHV